MGIKWEALGESEKRKFMLNQSTNILESILNCVTAKDLKQDMLTTEDI
jgi:hypothetical protein